MKTRWAWVSALALAAVGCGGDAEPSDPSAYTGADASSDPEPSGACVDSPPFEEVSAFSKCANCHSSRKAGADRKSAPPSVNFDTAAGADAVSESAVGMVRSGAMPPRASGVVLTELEKEQLYAWASCK